MKNTPERKSVRRALHPVKLEGLFLVSLGCPKNFVDSEVMSGILISHGIPLNLDEKSARYYLINTCAFLPSARQESVAAIREALRWKKKAPEIRKVIVAGCLVQCQEFTAIREQFPEVDYWSGVDGVPQIFAALQACENGGATLGGNPQNPVYLYDETTPRLQLTLPHVAYLKIADGCNNRCSYCAIPGIRGTLRSRSISSVKLEAANLLAGGVKELVLIAQDVTVFGNDRRDGASLAALLRELDTLPGDFWIRLLYTHPAHYTDELIAVLGSSRHTLPYLDIPLQHINDAILKRMNRHVDRKGTLDLLAKLRRTIPGLTLRTTFIAGLPGEGEAEYRELEAFIREQRFDRMGVFAYSPEPGTPAAAFPDQVPNAVAEERAAHLMQLQETISKERNRALLDKVVTVIADDAEGRHAVGRTAADAPEIDNQITFCGKKPLQAGNFYQVRISGGDAFDLSGEVC